MSTGLKTLLFGILCLIWSSTWMMIKVGLEGAPPFLSAGLRFILASFLIFAILTVRKIRLPKTRAFYSLTLFLGVFQMGLPYGLVYWSEQFISSGLTAILFSTMPLMVAVLARILLGDPLTVRKLMGIILGTGGVVVIFSDKVGSEGTVGGVLAALTSAFLASLSSVVVKKFSATYHPFASILLPKTYGGIILVVCAAVFERSSPPIRWDATTAGTIVYLAVFGSVAAFALYFWLIKYIDVTVLSYQTFIIPILAGLLGWIFLGETVTIDVAIGAGLILGGIVLTVLRRPRRNTSRGV